jgi:flagella basal body P-ring formation protein FlgA
LIRILFLSLFITHAVFAGALGETQNTSSRLSELIRASLTEKIADAEIRIPSLSHLMEAPQMSRFAAIQSVHLVVDKAAGIAQFEVLGTTEDGADASETIQTPYEAWKKVPVATHRIYPNTKLKSEDFKLLEVNVASGAPREFRGVMLSADTRFDSLETKQTILEGQYATSSAVTKSPDLRKGDSVKLELISGDLTLTTQAIVEEPASVGDHIRIMTNKTKRELMGIVRADHSVEVSL